MKHWKNYEPLENVVGFDARGAGPHLDQLSSSNPNYPECRIALRLGKLASGALTVEQSAELRAILERAERDVADGMAGRIEPDPPEVSERADLADGKEPARG